MTSTTQRPQRHTDEEFDKEHRKSNGLIITVIVLAILLLALGGWVAYQAANEDDTTATAGAAGATAAVPANVDEAINEYIDSWESQDGDAFREVVADNFVINEYIYFETPAGLELRTVVNEDDIDFIADFRIEPATNEPAWIVERGDEVVITGDGPWYVSFAESWAIEANVLDGMATYMVAEVDGVTKVANHYWIGVSKLIDF